jgi:large subunit ribosomal protein L6
LPISIKKNFKMRQRYEEEIKIPDGVSCEFGQGIIKFKKGDIEIERKISILGTELKNEKGVVKFICNKANRKNIAAIKTHITHIKNILDGLENKFVYEMEICNVHFPITAKVEKDKVLISNFLGEKVNRFAQILEGVEVEIKSQNVTVSSPDIEKAGQTAANIEKASRVQNKDRRIFQDGIFITSKPGGMI